MSENRKSNYEGDVFGEWTVLRKAEPVGDRKRRWIVGNEAGVEMTVLQTELAGLAGEATEKPLSARITESVLAANSEHRIAERLQDMRSNLAAEAVGVIERVAEKMHGVLIDEAELNPFAECADCQDVEYETEDVVVDSDNPFGADATPEDDKPAPAVHEDCGREHTANWPCPAGEKPKAPKADVQGALDAVIKAKVALNVAAKALEGLL